MRDFVALTEAMKKRTRSRLWGNLGAIVVAAVDILVTDYWISEIALVSLATTSFGSCA